MLGHVGCTWEQRPRETVMHLIRTLVPLSATAALLVGAAATPAGASPPRRAPVVTKLAAFGAVRGSPEIPALGSGSTIGPDGALYVTDGNNGRVLRIDRRTGQRSR